MKKRHIISISIICVVLMILGFFYGYKFAYRVGKKPKDIAPYNDTEGNMGNYENLDNDMPIIKSDNRYISPNTTIEYIIYYLQCGHHEKKVGKATSDMINMNEDMFKSFIQRHNPSWRVTSFSHEKVVIEIDKDQLCKNHYVIGVKDGKIAIFKIDDNGERVLHSILQNAPISMLKTIDQERLKKGIVVNSKEDISNILENFIS